VPTITAVFRRRRPGDERRIGAELRTSDGVATLVEQHGAMPEQHLRLRDLVLIRRLRALELADDRWQFSFRPEGLVELRGKQGAKLATAIRRIRPDVTVHVHHPDDDGSDGRSW
jgi:hypothetical protein